MELIYFVLTAYGLTQILVYGKIFESVRPSKKSSKASSIARCVLGSGLALFCLELISGQNYLPLNIRLPTFLD